MLRFEKYHGIGNDFLVIDVESPEALSVERSMALCDRHFGLGADGVLLVSPPKTPGARARMTVINSDGSQPEMCGNGLRCVALHLARKDGVDESAFVVDTDAGPLRCDVARDGDHATIGTQIGKGKEVGTFTLEHARGPFLFHRIETGNPHAICFRSPIESSLLDEVGPRVSGAISGGANVEIATVKSPTEIDVTVWERGVGRTLACGTGAAATVISGTLNGLCPHDVPVRVNLPGGPLEITVSRDQSAYLKGPAQWVYSAETHD